LIDSYKITHQSEFVSNSAKVMPNFVKKSNSLLFLFQMIKIVIFSEAFDFNDDRIETIGLRTKMMRNTE